MLAESAGKVCLPCQLPAPEHGAGRGSRAGSWGRLQYLSAAPGNIGVMLSSLEWGWEHRGLAEMCFMILAGIS